MSKDLDHNSIKQQENLANKPSNTKSLFKEK